MYVWIAIGIEFAGLVGSVIAIIVKYSNKIAVLEAENNRIRDEFKMINDALKIHEMTNEKTFVRIETEMKEINGKLDKLIGYYQAKNNQDFK